MRNIIHPARYKFQQLRHSNMDRDGYAGKTMPHVTLAVCLSPTSKSGRNDGKLRSIDIPGRIGSSSNSRRRSGWNSFPCFLHSRASNYRCRLFSGAWDLNLKVFEHSYVAGCSFKMAGKLRCDSFTCWTLCRIQIQIQIWVGVEEEEELTLMSDDYKHWKKTASTLLSQVVRWWWSWWIRDRLDTSTSCISKFSSNSITLPPIASWNRVPFGSLFQSSHRTTLRICIVGCHLIVYIPCTDEGDVIGGEVEGAFTSYTHRGQIAQFFLESTSWPERETHTVCFAIWLACDAI